MSPALGMGFDDPNAKPCPDTDTAGNAARRIRDEAQFIANMSNGQKHVIKSLQQELDRYREREAMHQGVIAEQRTRIETARQNADRAYGNLSNKLLTTIAGLRKHVDAAEAEIRNRDMRLEAKESCIMTLTEQLAYARNGINSSISATAFASLERRAAFGDRMAHTAGVNIK